MDAKNPVIPWSELEGQFFKVDVGSTNGDAYLSDIRTENLSCISRQRETS